MEKPSRPATIWSFSQVTDPRWRFSWPAGLGFAILCVLLSYPGRLNSDSLFALIAAETPGMNNNWHSATLGWFWNLPGPLLGQPNGALAMQAALFGIFAGFLPRLPDTLRGRATLAGEMLLRIVLAGSLGYVCKDATMLLALLIAVQLLRRLPAGRLGFVEIAMLIAVGVLFLLSKAPNFLTITVAAALVLPFLTRSPRHYAMLVVTILALGTLAIPFNRIVDARIFAARDLHPDKQVVLFDLAGISVRTGQNAFASVPGWPTGSLKSPADCYLPYMWDSFAQWAPCGGYATAYNRLDGALTRRWLSAIATHPLAYAQHRLAYVGYLMTSQDHATWGIDGQAFNDATIPAARAEMLRGLADLHTDRRIDLWRPSIATAPMRWLERTMFKFPKAQWAGLIACLAVLLSNWMRRQKSVRYGAILAAGFGVGNFAMLAVFGVADPSRYMFPTVALAYVALLAMLAPPQFEASAPDGHANEYSRALDRVRRLMGRKHDGSDAGTNPA